MSTATAQRFDWKEAAKVGGVVIGFMAVTGGLAAITQLSTHIVKTTPAGVVQTVTVDPGSEGSFGGIGTTGRGIALVTGSTSSSPRSVITTDTGRFVVNGVALCWLAIAWTCARARPAGGMCARRPTITTAIARSTDDGSEIRHPFGPLCRSHHRDHAQFGRSAHAARP